MNQQGKLSLGISCQTRRACAVLLVSLLLPLQPVSSQEANDEIPEHDKALESAINSEVYVELKAGTEYTRATLLRVKRDSKTKRIDGLRIKESLRGRMLSLNLEAVWQVAVDGKTIYQAPPAVGKNGRPPKMSKAEARAKRREEERKKWLARLEARGTKPWKDLTKEEHQETLDKHKGMVEKIKKTYPNIELYETDQFMFCTNIPPEQVAPYVTNLDEMFDMMCKMYRIRVGDPVWRGKALVVALIEKQQFQHFEVNFLQRPAPQTSYGLCHSYGDGEVIISCYRGDRRNAFAHMLVHETSHGFIHRYKTSVRLPSWVNEGMAEWIGQALVPGNETAKGWEREALKNMHLTRRIPSGFFTKDQISAWEYGIASSLTDFLIKKDKQKYVDFIEGMKEGEECEACFKRCYSADLDQLITAYGRAIGIPDLQK